MPLLAPSRSIAPARPFVWLNLTALVVFAGSTLLGADAKQTAVNFHRDIKPLLANYCYDCHGDGSHKGKVAFDELSDADLQAKPDLWLAVLKNVRAGMMPPDDGPRPTPEEVTRLADWIKFQALGLDTANPDPGRVTVRRLNRIEYRNTIRELMGTDFNSEAEFPPDDTGHGFDNIGDALSISPLHLEKYLQAAEQIANTAVPKVAKVLAVRSAAGRDFLRKDGSRAPDQMPVGKAELVSHTYTITDTEDYRIVAELGVRGSFDFDPNHCNLIMTVDGEKRHQEEVIWSENKTIHIDLSAHLTAGDHVVAFEIQPLEPIPTPKQLPFQRGGGVPVPAGPRSNGAPGRANDVPVAAAAAAPDTPVAPASVPATPTPGAAIVAAAVPPAILDAADVALDPAVPAGLKVAPVAARTAARLDLRIASVQINGPAAEKYWIAPENHSRFFPKGAAPAEPKARDDYAREVLRSFATHAFRRPVDEPKLDQLVSVARNTYQKPGKTFEEGFAKAAMIVLASPRFLFRIEPAPAGAPATGSAPVDQYALASRLSYLLWSTMPDEELFRAAGTGELRNTQSAQVARMLKDARAQAFVKNFTGQWLEARDVEFLPINPAAVLGLGDRRGNANAPRVDFDGVMRRAMRTEVEMAFDYVMREDRSVLELIDANYTFLNEKLAGQYGITGVSGDTFRKVDLPADSPRGGVLTDGAILVVTSNPTRTSPVKRGLFVLENILGTPPPPPPPDIPALEEAKKGIDGHEPTLRELLATHRSSPLCSSCHSRMDPLGLAFENFNALGMWRDTEAKQPIMAAGKLATGEAFTNVRELKHIITHERRLDYYRCITEKLMTYALGRGLEYYDLPTVDQIVAQLEKEQGKFSVLLDGVIQSAAFQRQRNPAPGTLADGKG